MFKEVFTSAGLELVQWMFKYDPTKRPNAEEVLNHEYFTKEEPKPRQASELASVEGDWHEFESKAARRENDKREKERKKEEYMREKEKRKSRDAGLPETSEGAKKAKTDEPAPGNTGGASVPVEASLGDKETKEDDNEDSEGDGSARMSMS